MIESKNVNGRKGYKWHVGSMDGYDKDIYVVWEGHPYDRVKKFPEVHTERHYHIYIGEPGATGSEHLPGFFGLDDFPSPPNK